MNDSFQEVEATLAEGFSVDSVLKTFEDVYSKVVYPPVQTYQVVLINKAIKYGRMDIVQEVIIKRGWPINGPYPSLPLHTACAIGRRDIVCLLLDNGANVNADANALGREGWSSPIYFALANDDVELLKMLLPYFHLRKNVTPLHFASMQNAVNCMKFLLDGRYFSPDHMADNFSMPLEIAVRTSAPITKLLLQHGAPLWHHRDDCMAVIHHAIAANSVMQPGHLVHYAIPDVVKLLLDAGADVNATYQNSNLMHMFFKHSSLIVHNVSNKQQTIEHVEKFGDALLEAARLIVNAGINVDPTDLLKSYHTNLEFIVGRYRVLMYPNKDELLEMAISMALRMNHDFLLIFIARLNSHDIESQNILDMTLSMLLGIMDYIDQYSLWSRSSVIFQCIYDIIRFQYLIIPLPGIPQQTLKTFLDALKSPPENPMISDLKLLVSNFASVETLKDLISEDLLCQRISLKYLVKLTVISSLSFPKDRAIDSLQLPIALKNYLLLNR